MAKPHSFQTAVVQTAFQRIVAVAVRFAEYWQFNAAGTAGVPASTSAAPEDGRKVARLVTYVKKGEGLEREVRESVCERVCVPDPQPSERARTGLATLPSWRWSTGNARSFSFP